jgi:apolipoprotein N-acyltransferase
VAATAASRAAPAGALPWFARRSRWGRRTALFVAGGAAAAALPPVFAIPLVFPALWLLVAALDAADARRAAFGAGWWFGFGYFVAGLYWLAWPLTLDLLHFGWMIPFAVFGVSAVLAVFIGLATLATALVGWRGVARAILLAVAWTAAAWLRGHLFTGFPWNLIATVWMPLDPMLQSAALWGAYGLSFVTVLAATLSAPLIDPAASRVARWGGAAAGALLLIGLAGGGWVRLASASSATVPGVHLRIVQGRIEQSLKWSPSQRNAIFLRYVRLSRAPGFDKITHVIWPETAIAYRMQTAYSVVRLDGDRLALLRKAIPPHGVLLTGLVRDDGRKFWNALDIIDADGRPRGVYEKHHLVPFGEYVPFRSVLRLLGVEKLAYGRGDYSPGPGPKTLPVPGAPPVSPLICYEAIFPGAVTGATRPGWLLNITNDAWFGITSGPYQHLASARLRAVEEGLPLVRAANTGISAVFDAYGRVRARLGLGRRGVVDAALPVAIPATPYARWTDWTLLILLVAALSVAAMFAWRTRG